MTTHNLKTWPAEFAALASGRKMFEWRADDWTPPAFAVDDTLLLTEYVPETKAFTGKVLEARVTYILRGAFGLPPGYAILSLAGVRPWVDQLGEDRKLVKRICEHADGMTDWELKFTESVAKQLEGGKALSGPQRDRAIQIDQERVR